MPDTKFKEGNEYYKLRKKNGRGLIFKDDDSLLDACQKYFDYCVANPILEDVAFNTKFGIVHDVLKRTRAFTKSGLCMFLGISIQTFEDYKKRIDFVEVVTHIENVIFTQKFEGAAAGQLKESIIVRDLGLTDKKATQHSGEINVKPKEWLE